MVILCYYWVMLDLHSEFLKFFLDLYLVSNHIVGKQYNSNFTNYELSLSIYSIKDISAVVYTMGNHERTLQIEYDDIRRKTKN